MKKTLLLMTILAGALTAQAGDYPYMVFTLSDGTTQSISSEGLTLTVSGDNLQATSGSETLTIALTALTKMEFSATAGTTGIATIESAKALTGDVEVYDLNGRRLPSAAGLSRGTYIIKSNGQSTKVQVK